MKKTIAFFFAVLCCAAALGQGVAYQGSPVINGQGQPIAGASVAITTANPCGSSPAYIYCGGVAQGTYTGATPPASLAILYTDVNATVATTNPLTTDPYGNWTVYLASAGTYWATIYGYGITTQVGIFTVGGSGGGGGGTGCIVNPSDGGCAIAGNPSIDFFPGPGGVGAGTGWYVQWLTSSANYAIPISVNDGTGHAGVVNLGCGPTPPLGSGVAFTGPPTCSPYVIVVPGNGSGGYWQGTYTGTTLSVTWESAINLGTSDVTGTLPINNGGTGGNTAGSAILGILPFTQIGSIPVGVAGPAWGILPGCVVSTCFLSELGNGASQWLQSPGTVPVGMTGASTFTQSCLIKGNGTSALSCGSITDNGTTIKSTEVAQFGNTQVLTADATPITATTPGTVVFTWGALTVSTNRSFHCSILYSQTTAAAAGDGIAVQGATNAPTRLDAWGKIDSTNPASTTYSGSAGSALNITSTTATSVVTVTPGASGTVYQAQVDGTIQVGASASTLNILMFTGNASDSIVPKAGSYCTLTP